MTPADDMPDIVFYNVDDPPPMTFGSPEEEAAFHAAVQEGLDDLDAGRTISGEAVLAWIRSWGTENELPPPECGD